MLSKKKNPALWNVEKTFVTFIKYDLRKLKKHKQSVNFDDIETLHQIRVSLRRIRSTLSLFQTLLPKKSVKHFLSLLKEITSSLNRGRDIDVYISKYFNKSELTDTEISLYKIISKQRKKEYKKINRLLQSKKYKKMLKYIDKWIKNKQWREEASPEKLKKLDENITPFAKEILQDYFENIRKQEILIRDSFDDEEAHKLRIKLKKFRYATDFFTDIFPETLRLVNIKLRELQDILGELHDIYETKELHKIFLENKTDQKLYDYTRQIEQQENIRREELKSAFYLKWQEFLDIKLDFK
jgi:CHAD domain-containing protein